MQQNTNKQHILKQIVEAENLNAMLSKTMAQLQNKVSEQQAQSKVAKKIGNTKTGNKIEEVDEKIIKNIDKRIQYYHNQLNKIQDSSSQQYVAQIREIESQIAIIERKTEEYEKQSKQILNEIKINNYHGKQEEQVNQSEINEEFRQIQELKKKLRKLKNTTISTDKLKPRSKSHAIFGNDQDLSVNASHLMQDPHHQQIDKAALYRNLIKYYNNEESRLQADIKKLEKERELSAQQQQKIQQQIHQTESQIQKLQQVLRHKKSKRTK